MTQMNVVTEEVEYCKLKVKYIADPSVVNEKIDKALSDLRNMNVSGFRPGKAPISVLKMKYKDKINQWVKREMLNTAHDDVLFETKIRPIGNPNVNSSNLVGDNFSCEMTYMKKPDFELKPYKGIDVPAPHMDETAEEIAERMIQDIREKHGESSPYGDGDFVQAGDKVALTYELSNGVKEDGKLYVVGSKMLPEFDENIFGMTPDESRSFKVDVNGEAVDCTVTLHMGMKRVPCALDDSLAKACGINSYDEFREAVNASSRSQYKAQRDGKIAMQIQNMLVEANDFECPDWLVSMEAQQIAMQSGLKWEDASDEVKNSLKEQGVKNVKFSLILDSIRLDNGETVISDQEAVSGIRSMLAQRGIPDTEGWLNNAQKSGMLHGMVAKFKNDYTVQWVVDNAKVVE